MSDLPQCVDCVRVNIETRGGRCWSCDRNAARAEGVASERARVVADLRRKADIVSVMRSMEATTTARALRERADRYERGEHDKEGT